jgi:hypothetical protein
MVDSKTCGHLVYSYLFTLSAAIPVLFLVYSLLLSRYIQGHPFYSIPLLLPHSATSDTHRTFPFVD